MDCCLFTCLNNNLLPAFTNIIIHIHYIYIYICGVYIGGAIGLINYVIVMYLMAISNYQLNMNNIFVNLSVMFIYLVLNII